MAKNRTKCIIFFIIIFTIILTGCWDSNEIEELGLVLGIAIDKPKSSEAKEKESKEAKEHEEGKRPRFTLTQQFVVPKAIRGGAEYGGAPTQKPYSNVASEGDAIHQIIRQFASVTSRRSFFKHLKVIIISEEVALSTDLQKLLILFLKDHEMERSIEVFISKGDARDVLEIKPEKEDIPAFKLLTMGKNVVKSSRIAPVMTLGDMSKKMTAQSSFIMQRIAPHKDDIVLGGAAVIKGKSHKMIGFLGEEETDGLNWLSGKGKAGVVEAIDKETEEMIIYEISRINSKIIPNVENGMISFDVKIDSEGKISEDWLVPGNEFDETFIKKTEKAIKDEILILIDKALYKTQKEFEVDVAGFGKKLSIKYPKVWEEVKDNWDETFSDIPIDVELEINIRTFGEKGKK